MSRYQSVRILGRGPDGPVDEVVPDRLGGEPLARRRLLVPVGPRRHRLRDTAEDLARLGHPGIATVVDLVEVDHEVVEVLTTLGPDGSLADRVAAGSPPVHEVHHLLVALADALAAAHGAGVAHGHVSAANVVHRAGAPLLTDFGIREARTGRPEADPFRRDVEDLAGLGASLLDPDDVSPPAAALRSLLCRAADDPACTLADLRTGLDHLTDPGPHPRSGMPVPARAGESACQLGAGVAATAAAPAGASAPLLTGARLFAGSVALVVGLFLGAAVTLIPGGGGDDEGQQAAETALACDDVAAELRADVDGDGCDEPLRWRAASAELAYPDRDGAPLRFRIGRPGDQLVVGDWNCDGTATAAVVRTGSGQTFLFDEWAGPDETLTAVAGPSVPAGAEVAVVGDGSCDRIEPVARRS